MKSRRPRTVRSSGPTLADPRWVLIALANHFQNRYVVEEGAMLRVSETWVRGRTDGPKSRAGKRTIPISATLAAELFDHRARSVYQADEDLVFVSPHRGSNVNPKRYAETFRAALAKAEIAGYVRPFHDGRHSAITNAARAGRREHALMTLAGR